MFSLVLWGNNALPPDGFPARMTYMKKGESPGQFATSLAVLIFLVVCFKSSILDANNIPSGSMIPTLKIGDYLFVNKMRYSLRIPFTEIELFRIDDPRRGDIVTFVPPHETGKNFVKRVTGMPGDRVRIRNLPLCEYYRLYKIPMPAVKREFACEPGNPLYANQAVVAVVEFKEHDQGNWKDYRPVDVSSDSARQMLMDADNTEVLHPDFLPWDSTERPRTVLMETIPGGTHLITEGVDPVRADGLCNEVESEGCVIPEDSYLMMGDNRDDSRDSRSIGYIKREKILGKAVIIYFSINWRDLICRSFMGLDSASGMPQDLEHGFRLPDFPPEEQRRKCSTLDLAQEDESVFNFLRRTVLYRLSRLSVRWERIGTLLK